MAIAKEASGSHDDRRIYVLIAEGKSFSATTFPETEIERIVGDRGASNP
jgi:hypothetical protein